MLGVLCVSAVTHSRTLNTYLEIDSYLDPHLTISQAVSGMVRNRSLSLAEIARGFETVLGVVHHLISKAISVCFSQQSLHAIRELEHRISHVIESHSADDFG